MAQLEAVAAWSAQPDWPTAETKAMWTDFVQSFTPRENRTWAERRYWAKVAWLGVPPPPGTSVQIHHWGGQQRVLSTDGTLNPGRAVLLRAQVAQDVGRINITYLGPADLSGG